MGCQLQTSSGSKRDPFRLDNVGYSDSETGTIADVPHYLIFQVSWDYDEIFETVPGQMRQDVMDYRVWTQRKHWLGPCKRERTQTRSFSSCEDYCLQLSGEVDPDSRSSSVSRWAWPTYKMPS